MSNNMPVAEIVYERVKSLPESKQRDALTFVNYLSYMLGRQQAERAGFQKYRFSDIAGKLTWRGDAVAVQRAIRDEW